MIQKEKRIAIIDDDRIDRLVIKRYIEELAMDNIVEEFENGKEALDWMIRMNQDHEFTCLIFLDIKMPVMNGLEFLDALERTRLENVSPIIVAMYTTSRDPDDIATANKSHLVKDYVLKSDISIESVKQILAQFENT